MKLNLRCGTNVLPGCLNIDSYELSAPILASAGLQYQQHDFSKPFTQIPDNSIDEIETGVLLQTSLIPPIDTIYEMARMLKPGGEVHFRYHDISKLAKRITKLPVKERAEAMLENHFQVFGDVSQAHFYHRAARWLIRLSYVEVVAAEAGLLLLKHEERDGEVLSTYGKVEASA